TSMVFPLLQNTVLANLSLRNEPNGRAVVALVDFLMKQLDTGLQAEKSFYFSSRPASTTVHWSHFFCIVALVVPALDDFSHAAVAAEVVARATLAVGQHYWQSVRR